jgi:diguanylate cyclase (GGDEF)-like protein
LLAIPLRDGENEIGVLVLQQCGQQRRWRSNDLAALEALAEHIVMAVSNVRLRSLMKALAVTDEHSGLLHRDSYLTCLLSECERMRTQKLPLTVALLQFSMGGARPGDGAGKQTDDLLQKFASSVVTHLRQSDIAVRYGPQALAFVLPGTSGKDATVVSDKMRKLAVSMASAAAPGAAESVRVTAGIAECLVLAGMDGADLVTELVNRAEWALEAAQQPGSDGIRMLEPPVVA